MRAGIIPYLAWITLVASIFLIGAPALAPASAIGSLQATSSPGPTVPAPVLLGPPNNAAMPQPVAPQMWTFRWSALGGVCKCSISIWQPNGNIHLYEGYMASDGEYVYYYTSAFPIPPESMEPWYWKVWVTCPYGSNESETRTFRIVSGPTPTPKAYLRLPLLLNRAP